MDVQQGGSLPVLTTTACPYPDLAEQDRSICNVEQMLYSELLGAEVQLASCRLDGAECCSFHNDLHAENFELARFRRRQADSSRSESGDQVRRDARLDGANGSGKSTLGLAVMGHPNYEVTEGSIELDGRDLTELGADERARAGLFMAFQRPVAIPGVKMADFLRHATTNVRNPERKEGEELIPMREFRRSCGRRWGSCTWTSSSLDAT
jgi:hypothetical protein